jgi:cell division protein FtsB
MRKDNSHKIKTFLSSPITLVFALIVLVFVARSAWQMNIKSRDIESKKTLADMKLTELQKEEMRLTQDIEYLSTEEGVEYYLRSKYKAVKPGESVAIIIESETTTATATPDIKSDESFWSKIKSIWE